MEIRRSDLQPSDTRISVMELSPIVVGNPADVIDRLRDVTKWVHHSSKVIIGSTDKTKALPRFKNHEVDVNGFTINKILLIYQASNPADATYVESLLINKFKNRHPNNRNISSEQKKENGSRDSEYFVYLACEKLEDDSFTDFV